MEVKSEGFGRFCNYCFYWVEGKNSQTGKKKIKKVRAVSEASAIQKADAAGVAGPYNVRSEALDPPTDRQQAYAQRLGLTIPEGCTSDDLGAILSRHTDFEGDPDPEKGLEDFAQACGVCFSAFDCEKGLLQRMIAQLGAHDRAVLFCYAVRISRSGTDHFGDPRSCPDLAAFEKFAAQVAADPSLMKSLEGRELSDYLHPNARSKVYKIAASCLN